MHLTSTQAWIHHLRFLLKLTHTHTHSNWMQPTLCFQIRNALCRYYRFSVFYFSWLWGSARELKDFFFFFGVSSFLTVGMDEIHFHKKEGLQLVWSGRVEPPQGIQPGPTHSKSTDSMQKDTPVHSVSNAFSYLCACSSEIQLYEIKLNICKLW